MNQSFYGLYPNETCIKVENNRFLYWRRIAKGLGRGNSTLGVHSVCAARAHVMKPIMSAHGVGPKPASLALGTPGLLDTHEAATVCLGDGKRVLVAHLAHLCVRANVHTRETRAGERGENNKGG